MLLITGLPRSGTSAVAALAHHLGVDMGLLMVMPVPGTDPEYEDSRLSTALSLHALLLANAQATYFDPTPEPPTLVSRWAWFANYFAQRERECARPADQPTRWGVKSPLLLLHTDAWSTLPGTQLVLTERDPAACRASLERATDRPIEREALFATQALVEDALRRYADAGILKPVLTISHEESTQFPLSAARKLCAALGLSRSEEQLARAASMVRAP